MREQLNEAVARLNVCKGKVYYDFYPEMICVLITFIPSKTKFSKNGQDYTLELRLEKVDRVPGGSKAGWQTSVISK